MEKLTLGSGSPRRLELIKKIWSNLDIKIPEIEEVFDDNLSVEENAKKIALDKLDYIKTNNPDAKIILTADTFISFKNRVLGKPKDKKEAYNMIKLLSGNTHKVLTGVSIYKKDINKTLTEVDITEVKFRTLTDYEIKDYLKYNEWIDAAGAYKIQERGEILIESINGSYSSVMGLPISRIYGMFLTLNLFIR